MESEEPLGLFSQIFSELNPPICTVSAQTLKQRAEDDNQICVDHEIKVRGNPSLKTNLQLLCVCLYIGYYIISPLPLGICSVYVPSL